MARVYRAEHEGLQRQVALKVLIDGYGKDEGHQRFLREARMIAAIKHPNVVNIFDVGVHGGRPYLVMELLEGMDLDAFVSSEGPLDEAMLVDVIIPIAAGLAAVHDAGIVHRDLKPGNVFLTRGRNDELEPKLLDFGISKPLGPDEMRLTHSKGLLLGTPFYMSPEATRGLEMTPLSDQYSLGVVLYEAATGSNPFAGASTFGEVIRQVTTGDFPPIGNRNPGLSRRIVSIIERAMHLDPASRFPDMRALGRELLALAGQRTRITWGMSFNDVSRPDAPGSVPSPPLPLRESQRPPRRAGKSRYVAPVALVLLASAAAVWMNRAELGSRAVAAAHSDDDAEAQVALGLRAAESAEQPASGTTVGSPSLAAPALPEGTEPDVFEALPEENQLTELVPQPDPDPASPRAEAPAPPPRRAAARAPRKRTRVKKKARRRPVRRRAVARAPAPDPAETAPVAAPEPESTPDWVISARRESSVGRDGPARGTNSAPILE
jgi:hypothetical protein